ncbi:MAG: DEAD/DEAH box helicase [Acidobacteriota bacterium]|nr:DEAD/DEAH box helicase [Acidobacteriota bacterium]
MFHPAVRQWFDAAFERPTRPQRDGWPPIARGESTLILAPTGTGKTLTAFLWCLDRLMFEPPPETARRCRVLYISPLKALAVDVERNLRAPLAGIARVADARGETVHPPVVMLRTGDTPAAERARFQRAPADILITTPESLFLLLTSNARERLRSVETVIVDEIHALVSTKRGAHLALSLERLEHLAGRRLQRIGLSATQRNLDEVARFLGGAQPGPARDARRGSAKADAERALHDEFAGVRAEVAYRPVTLVDAREPKRLAVTVEVPMADMAAVGTPVEQPSGPAAQASPVQTIWSSIYPRLLELVRTHRSTLLFVNSRRLAERLAGALNELAGETLVRAHHGSLARAQRSEIEDLLKAGRLRALVATSSLELGIDMGAIDLVIQIEAPPSVASGLQRIGRSGHRIDEVSEGVIFPKFRGDLLAAAAVTGAMRRGQVEPSRYPRNPLDVLAQHVVAMTAMDRWAVDALFDLVRAAAPFAELSHRVFEGVLDMLSGRYPSDEFAELKPRVTWDRVNGTVTARQGAGRVAVANAGTIPDRGLFGVFLTGADRDQARVGELDEEMVFEARAGETFLLGASTWRIDQITHDRVLVSPAPGEPGKMPFWKGEGPGRPIELGMAIGRLTRELRGVAPAEAVARLHEHHGLDRLAAENLLQYLDDQARAAEAVPDDRTILIERTADELGDWRISVLSPFGSRVHAPWAMAVTARLRDELGLDAEVMWSDDGFVVRVPEGERPPDSALFLPDPDDVEGLIVRQLGSTALFAARFREAAGRALLLPRRRPGARAPLWQQRKRAADLLAVAARFGSFPIILETYRECLRDIFDVPALVDLLRRVRSRSVRVATVDPRTPSPFAASLLFGYVANYLYDGDAPLAERRAQALSVDQSQLRELIGEGELRELLDADALAAIELDLQCLSERFHARSADGVHDLLLRLGDLSADEIGARVTAGLGETALAELTADRRVLEVRVSGKRRAIAVEDAARYRDGLGVPLPPGLPESLLEPVADALGDLVRRYARTHGPFTAADTAARLGLGSGVVSETLRRLAQSGRVVEGEFRPGGHGREWCDAEVLRAWRRRSLARLRHDVEPVEPHVLGRFLLSWHGLGRKRRGLDGLLDVVEQLQGAPLVASVLERHVLPARVDGYEPSLLDTLISAGEVTWMGVEPLGERDGRIAMYLTDQARALLPPRTAGQDHALLEREARIVSWLAGHGASFFGPLHEAVGGGFPHDTVEALWSLVWKGLVTNDTLHALRAYSATPERGRRASRRAPFRSRRLVPPSAEGRWSVVGVTERAAPTTWAKAMAEQLLARHGVVTRDIAALESLPGGFTAVYPVLQRLEETGRVRRGYFVAGLGAAQFAQPGAVDLLRAERDRRDDPETSTLAATDPANPYGTLAPWPAWVGAAASRATRSAGARVILVDGHLAAWVARGDRQLLVALAADEPERSRMARAVAQEMVRLAYEAPAERRGWLVAEINGVPASEHPAAHFLIEAGFAATSGGMQLRVPRRQAGGHDPDPPVEGPTEED